MPRFNLVWEALTDAQRQAIAETSEALGVARDRWPYVSRLRLHALLAAGMNAVREAEAVGRTREAALLEAATLFDVPVSTLDMAIRRAIEDAIRVPTNCGTARPRACLLSDMTNGILIGAMQ